MIFETMRANINYIENRSVDSVDRIENRNLEEFISMNDENVRKIIGKICELQREFQ